MTTFFDLRPGRVELSQFDQQAIVAAIVLCALIPWGVVASSAQLVREKSFLPIADQTARITTMVFTILIVFMLVRPQGIFGKREVKKV